MPWLKLSCRIPGQQFSDLSKLLMDAGAASVCSTNVDAAAPILEPAPASHPLWNRLRLEALFPLQTDIAAVNQQVKAHFDGRCLPEFEASFLEDRDWSETWREGLSELIFGERLRVLPKQDKNAQTSHRGHDCAVLYLDPGLAFGTGTHATTRLCLEWLAAQRLTSLRLVDYGCGSGILGLAALQLGANHVTAIDYDAQALLATRDNARFNGVDLSRLRISLPTQLSDAERKPVDVLLANILARPLQELASDLSALVKSGGALVLSGILEDQVRDVMAAYPEFTFQAPRLLDDWVCLLARKESVQRHG